MRRRSEDRHRGARLFAYGTLEDRGRLRTLTGRRFPASAATLDGYACYRLEGRGYPGIVEKAGSSTPGTLYRGVDAGSLRRLDRYEGREFERRRVIATAADGERHEAWAYVIAPAHRGLLDPRSRWVRLAP